MYLIKDSRCSLRASFHSSASFPSPASLPFCPQTTDTESANRVGQREGAGPVGPRGSTDVHQLQLWSLGSAVFQAPSSSTNLHGIHIRPTLYLDVFKAAAPSKQSKTVLSVSKVLTPQGHPNTCTNPDPCFWGQRLLLIEGFP